MTRTSLDDAKSCTGYPVPFAIALVHQAILSGSEVHVPVDEWGLCIVCFGKAQRQALIMKKRSLDATKSSTTKDDDFKKIELYCDDCWDWAIAIWEGNKNADFKSEKFGPDEESGSAESMAKVGPVH